jgi:hypothetical protein
VVRADSPAALLAVGPHLLGFVPEASVVVIGLTPPRDRVRVTLRYDLPDPPEADLVAGIAGHAAGVISSQQLPAAIAVGYGPEPLVTLAADALRDAAQQAGIDLHDVLRVEGGRYWSYRCGDESCCPAAGVPFDATAHPAAADMAAAGKQVLADRPAVAARVAPVGGIAAESMRQATRRAEQHVARLLAKVRRSSRFGAARHMIAAEGLAAAGEMIARYRGGGRFTSDYEVALLTVALRDLRVRDDAWARMDPAHTDAHLRLWTDVTRRAQPGHVAAPATLLALASRRQHQVMARRDTYHLSTRLRRSPSAMTQARSGAVRSAAGQTYTVIMIGRSATRCDCGFDIIEESLKYQVMKRLDPLTPDRLVLPDRAALDHVKNNRRAFGDPQLEPVLGLQLSRPDHPERTRGPRTIELFPEHQSHVVQTVSLPQGSRSDLRRPDTAEVRDECSDLLWRRRDDPLVAVRDLHSSVTSRGAVAETHRFCTRIPGRGPARVTHGDLGGFAGVRQRTARPHRWLGPAPPGWPWPGRI